MSIEISYQHVVRDPNPDWPHDEWAIILKNGGKKLTTTYRTDIVDGVSETEVLADHVLECLEWDVSMGDKRFYEYCDELGVSSDSRDALDNYITSQNMGPKLREFLK
jgi:hypothetical protein